MLDVTRHDGLPDGDIGARWQALVEADPDATVFQTPAYLRLWTRELGDPDATSLLVVTRDDDAIGIAPVDVVTVEGRRRLRLLGGDDVTDYLGPVAEPKDRADVARALAAHLAGIDDIDEIVLAGLAEDVGWPDLFRTAADDHEGLTLTADEVDDVCPVVDLRAGFEAHLDALDGDLRREQARKARKLAREVGPLEMVEVAADDLADQLSLFFEMAAGDESDKGDFFRRDDMRRWFLALADEFGGGWFRLHLLLVDSLPAAGLVSLVQGGEWGLYNSAFDDALGAYAPGMVQIAMLIEEAAADHDRFDLLRGDESYKYRFGAVDRTLARLTLLPNR